MCPDRDCTVRALYRVSYSNIWVQRAAGNPVGFINSSVASAPGICAGEDDVELDGKSDSPYQVHG